MAEKFIQTFKEINRTDVEMAGGKGASLGEMTQAGIPVPPGFVVLASAFDFFLHQTGLLVEIQSQLANINHQDISSIERASRVIHDLINDAGIPSALEVLLKRSFNELGSTYVAVRSSATAEDSAAASWAGELETYLNTTEDNFLENIKKCWASLFTPRAIVYRKEKGLHESYVAVAVVVQTMVESEVAGIVFTVHPVTKDRNQMIIEACWGLGEFIVGGLVTPDSYVIDKKNKIILDTNIVEQEKMLVRGAHGNESVEVPKSRKSARKLSEEQIKRLFEICLHIEDHYRFPCDIEWAMTDDKIYILQSRPITTI